MAAIAQQQPTGDTTLQSLCACVRAACASHLSAPLYARLSAALDHHAKEAADAMRSHVLAEAHAHSETLALFDETWTAHCFQMVRARGRLKQ